MIEVPISSNPKILNWTGVLRRNTVWFLLLCCIHFIIGTSGEITMRCTTAARMFNNKRLYLVRSVSYSITWSSVIKYWPYYWILSENYQNRLHHTFVSLYQLQLQLTVFFLLNKLKPDMAFCRCGPSTSEFDVLCNLSCFSAHHNCNVVIWVTILQQQTPLLLSHNAAAIYKSYLYKGWIMERVEHGAMPFNENKYTLVIAEAIRCRVHCGSK